MPVHVYPMFDIALRARDGLTPERTSSPDLVALVAVLGGGRAQSERVDPEGDITPEEIAEPTPANRMIGFPYTKLMNSNNMVEQGAGLIMCSVERAEALGVPRDRWVFLQSGSDAHDHWFVSNRADLSSSPAMRLAGRAALEGAGIGIDDLAHIDLYSCFPSAVQIGARELGLGLDRQLTVTGGMSFAGGPVEQLRHALHRDDGRAPPRGRRRIRSVQRERRLRHQTRLRRLLVVNHRHPGGSATPSRRLPSTASPVASWPRTTPER